MDYTFVSMKQSDKPNRDYVLTLRHDCGKLKHIHFSERSRDDGLGSPNKPGHVASMILRGPHGDIGENLVEFIKQHRIKLRGPAPMWNYVCTV